MTGGRFVVVNVGCLHCSADTEAATLVGQTDDVDEALATAQRIGDDDWTVHVGVVLDLDTGQRVTR